MAAHLQNSHDRYTASIASAAPVEARARVAPPARRRPARKAA
jgi:hypothetical protein